MRAELAALLAAADHDPGTWVGAAGVTDRAVPAALVDGAQAACTLTPSASTRQLAETANVSRSTVAVSLERLRTRGWLRREQPAAGTLAITWRLVRPERIKDPPAHVDQVLDALPPRPLTPAGGSAARTTLSRIQCRRSRPGRRLVVRRPRRRRPRRHHGSAARHPDRPAPGDRQQLPSSLAAAATVLGSTGTTARRAARHTTHRQVFTIDCTEFAARHGWAIQRGPYRPNQPDLPLRMAA